MQLKLGRGLVLVAAAVVVVKALVVPRVLADDLRSQSR
jgi:hypothetical protein